MQYLACYNFTDATNSFQKPNERLNQDQMRDLLIYQQPNNSIIVLHNQKKVVDIYADCEQLVGTNTNLALWAPIMIIQCGIDVCCICFQDSRIDRCLFTAPKLAVFVSNKLVKWWSFRKDGWNHSSFLTNQISTHLSSPDTTNRDNFLLLNIYLKITIPHNKAVINKENILAPYHLLGCENLYRSLHLAH